MTRFIVLDLAKPIKDVPKWAYWLHKLGVCFCRKSESLGQVYCRICGRYFDEI